MPDNSQCPDANPSNSEQISEGPSHTARTVNRTGDTDRRDNPPLKLGLPPFIRDGQDFTFSREVTTAVGYGFDSWVFSIEWESRTEEDTRCCCRYVSGKQVRAHLICQFLRRYERILYQHEEFTPAYEASEDKYLVVGIRTSDDSAPRERVLRISSDGDMFKQIRNTIGEFRPMYRRLLSLKGVSSFGIYQCFIHSDDHAPRQLDRETQRSLELFFAAFRSGGNKKHGNHRWIQWVHQEFNSASVDPAEGKYTLELKLDWSAPKFVFWGMAPILLSIVIGLWYMLKPLEEGADYIAVVQTGWTIASYIVTAAAILLGILAAITQFGDV